MLLTSDSERFKHILDHRTYIVYDIQYIIYSMIVIDLSWLYETFEIDMNGEIRWWKSIQYQNWIFTYHIVTIDASMFTICVARTIWLTIYAISEFGFFLIYIDCRRLIVYYIEIEKSKTWAFAYAFNVIIWTWLNACYIATVTLGFTGMFPWQAVIVLTTVSYR